ncbi:unnamed protein product [Cylicostephanus goldi]|uniref:Uncharacterized protein n=1 Tax=Cylicostephanus goldi TaxID=71465 RepID=A0A3P7PN48_CYLGO|nr:unnamed protein product [Cylicostephanus goldi]
MDEDEESNEITPDQALEFLRVPEAVMEPGVAEAIRIYLEEGSGSSETAIEAMVTGYNAYAQAVNMMSDWLTALGDVPPEEPVQVAQPKKTKRGRRGAKTAAKKAEEEEARRKEEEKAKEPDTPKSPTKKHEAEKRLDPFYGRMEAVKSVENTLAALIAKHFSPDIADTIFEDGGVIEWLPELINHKRWRTLLYELMDQYPNCLMLNFAVKLISDAGFQTEISTVSSAAQQLDIFSRVLLTSIDAVLVEHRKGCLTAAYEKAFGELVRVVCQAEHTYVYTIALLKAVGTSQGGRILAACEQMADALRAEMEGREHETTALRTALAQTADDQVKIHQVKYNVASHFTQALLNMVSRGELNPADVTIIYDQYILPLPPPISIIRDPIFIDLLLDSLFHYQGPKTIPEHRFKYIFLLACAASVSETRSSNGRRTQSRLELDNCRQCLDDAVSLLEGMDDLLAELNDLLHAIKMPVVAAGVLYYVQTLLLSEERTGDPPGAALCLLDHISTLHPNLHAKAFDVCCQLYEKIAGENEAAESSEIITHSSHLYFLPTQVIMERQRLVVDRFVHLLSVGGAIPVLEKVWEMFRDGQIDASLVRYFAMEVLEIIAPPFSDDLVNLFLPMVSDEEIFDKAAQVIMERQRLVVDRFVHLLSVGGAIPVLEKVWEMFRDGQIDASLVRYFAMEVGFCHVHCNTYSCRRSLQVLEIIAPPFSDDLVNLFLPMVSDEEIFDKAAQERFPPAGEFIQHCQQQLPSSSAVA